MIARYATAIGIGAAVTFGLLFVMQLLMGGMNATRPGDEGGVAFGAHIGGFVAGLLLVTLFKRRNVPLWRAY